MATLEALVLPPGLDLVERARLLHQHLMKFCNRQFKLHIDASSHLFFDYSIEFDWLSLPQNGYIEVSGVTKKNDLREISIKRTRWTRLTFQQTQPLLIVRGFIDGPNLLGKPKAKAMDGTPKLNYLYAINWKRFQEYLRGLVHGASQYEMRLYVTVTENSGQKFQSVMDTASGSGFQVFETYIPHQGKDVDSSMIVDLVDVSMTEYPKGSSVIHILGCGDIDYYAPLMRNIERAKVHGINYRIILVSWKDSLSKYLNYLEGLTHVHFDEIAESLCVEGEPDHV
jgi:hypothetical protein